MSFDDYPGKHFARVNGLLKSCRKFLRHTGKSNIKYFTLCAKDAIDVFMLEKANILTRDNDGKLTGIVICESSPQDADEIFKLVRPPVFESMLIAPLQDIILFTEDSQTRLRQYDEDEPDRMLRRKLRIKDLHGRFINSLPFDVINFDTFGYILGGNDDDKALMRSFLKLFQLQGNASSFLMSITVPLSRICDDYKLQFQNSIEDNFSRRKEIKDKVKKKYNTINYQSLEENFTTSLGFAKSVFIKTANQNGWHTTHESIIIYESDKGNKMMSLVSYLEKSDSKTFEDSYIADILKIIEFMPTYMSYAHSVKSNDIRKDLEDIILYRERIRSRFQNA